jgi:anti-sigma B factor antagonist
MLAIAETSAGDVTVLHLTGRLVIEDGDTPLGATIDRLLAAGRVKLVLDLRQVTYIDSAGLGLLVSRYVRARRRGGDLRLVQLSQRSQHLMTITKLSAVFAVFASEADAIQSYTPPA